MSESITQTDQTDIMNLMKTEGPENFDRELSIPGDQMASDEDATDGQDTEDDDTEGLEGAKEGAEAPEQTETEARIAKLARDLRERNRRIRQMELENQALKGERTETFDEQTERVIEQRAQQKIDAKVVYDKSTAVLNAGVKEYGQAVFNEALTSIADAMGAQPYQALTEAVLDIPDAHKLLRHLADNPDLAEEIASLPLHRMGVALAKEAAKVTAPKVKQMSKAPPPPTPLASTRSAPVKDPNRMSMEEFVKYSDDIDRRNRGF